MAVEWALLGKAGLPLVGKVTAPLLESVTLSWRVSWRVKRQAARQDIKVSFFRLRAVLHRLDVLQALNRGDWDLLRAHEESFADLIRSEADDAETTTLLKILVESYIASLKPAEAIATQGQRIESAVEKASQATAHQIDARNSDEATFEHNLGSLNRFRADEARGIKSAWPNVTRAVAEMIASTTRSETLELWSDNRPGWMSDLPVAALCWLGNISSDYSAATNFYAEAIANGAVPRSYWIVKHAIVSGPIDKISLSKQLADATPHPLSSAILSATDHDAHGMLKHLRNWEPATEEDDCLRNLLSVKALRGLGNLEEAATMAIATADHYETGAAHLAAAHSLLAQGATRSRPNYLGDLQEGLRHALKAREVYRTWQGDSSDAVRTVALAYSLVGDNLSAWKSLQPPPVGAATEREASHENIRTESCLLSANLGMTSRARELLEYVKDPGTLAHVQALIAESENDAEEADKHWIEAFSHATDPGLGLSIATHMARSGLEIPIPDWEGHASDDLNDLRLIASVFRHVEGSLQLARSRQLESRHILSALIDFYSEQGNLAESATTAENGAKRWNDPDLWLTAARVHLKLKGNTEAARCAEKSLHAGGGVWRRRTEAYKVLIEVKSAAGDSLGALEYAAQLFTEQPTDLETQWALISCQEAAGDVEGAWDTYKNRANQPSPRSSQELRTWLRLNRQFGNPFDIDRALDLADQWSQDEEVRANVLLTVLLSDVSIQSKSTEQRYAAAFEQFRKDFPESQYFQPQDIDPDNLLKSFDQLMERLPDYSEEQEQISAGLAPLGLATLMRKRSYAELIISGGAGVIYGGDPSTLETEIKALEDVNTVVLDTTAMHSLVLLDNETSRVLLGTFSSAMTTVEQYRDALGATDSSIFNSELSVYKDPATGRAKISQTPPDELEMNRQRAKALLEIFKRTQRVSNPELRHFPGKVGLLPWLSASDLADRQSTIFWCDDRVLRAYAAQIGIRTVGTTAVLKKASRSGVIDPNLADVAEAVLIQNRFVGITFTPKVYELAAEMSTWKPRGAATAVLKHGPGDANELAKFVLNAIQHVLDSPADVRDWVSVFAQWLVSVIEDVSSATEALIYWLRLLSDEDWMTADLMVFATEGVRSAADGLEGVVDPLSPAMNLLYKDLAKRTDESLAAQYLTGLMSRMNSDDKGSVYRDILLS